MTRCDHCGNECTLPFTCQHCGGKFCADCRLPPNHACTGIGRWNKKPRPSVGISYSKGSVSAIGGISGGNRPGTPKKTGDGIPYLKIMAIILILILLGIAWLVLSGYRGG